MKTSLLSVSLLSVAIASGFYLTGCAGGGGQGGGGRFPAPGGAGQNPDPAGQDPGQGWNPANSDAITYVESKGRVVVVQSNGDTTPLAGATINVVSDGANIDRAVSDQRGIYRLRLKRFRQNAITASKPGYQFDQATAFLTPNRPEVVPDFKARIIKLQIPGQPNQVADPLGGENRPAALSGVVVGRLSVDPTAGALDALLDVNVLIRDASSNRVIQSIRTNNQNTFSYEGPVGKDIVIEPSSRGNLRWYPSSRRIRIGRQRQEVSFQWRADVRNPSPPNLQTPRPVRNPSPTFPQAPRPVQQASPSASPTARPAINRPVWLQQNP